MHILFMASVCALLYPGLFMCQESQRQKGAQLERFFIVEERVSDAGPYWFDYIMDVKPEGRNVLVRNIRIAPANYYCPDRVTVKAIEAHIPNITVRKLAGRYGLCIASEQDVDRAIGESKPKRVEGIFESRKDAIVVRCGEQDRIFRLPFPEYVDMRALKYNAPTVAALYELYFHVYRRAFRDKDVFYDITPEEEVGLEQLGESLLPELRSGIYDLGFADNKQRKLCLGKTPCDLGLTRELVQGYEGADHKSHEPTVQVLNRDKYQLTNFIAPEYPPLAKMARIAGSVEIKTWVDTTTGTVKRVQAISGHALLQKAAENSIVQWIFQPGAAINSQPLSILMEFKFNCDGGATEKP